MGKTERRNCNIYIAFLFHTKHQKESSKDIVYRLCFGISFLIIKKNVTLFSTTSFPKSTCDQQQSLCWGEPPDN